MSRYISESLKKSVIQSVHNCCEYCLVENDLSFIPHQIEHIISLKHGGTTSFDNLAYACFSCNNNTGGDIGTMLLPKKIYIRFLIQELIIGMNIFNLKTDCFCES